MQSLVRYFRVGLAVTSVALAAAVLAGCQSRDTTARQTSSTTPHATPAPPSAPPAAAEALRERRQRMGK